MAPPTLPEPTSVTSTAAHSTPDLASTLAAIDAAGGRPLIDGCREELQCLWGDLSEAIRRAFRCTWSIEALNVKERIQTLTKLVGPTSWESVQIDLLESGIYQQVHAEIGIEIHPDMDQVADLRRYIDARGSR